MPQQLQSQRSSRPTADHAPVDGAALTRDLGFLCELVGAKGEALKAMKPQIAEFKKRYGLDATGYSQVVATYRDKNDGPSKARRKLVKAVDKMNGIKEEEIES